MRVTIDGFWLQGGGVILWLGKMRYPGNSGDTSGVVGQIGKGCFLSHASGGPELSHTFVAVQIRVP